MKRLENIWFFAMICIFCAGLVRAGSEEEAWAELVGKKFMERPEFTFVKNNPDLPNVLIYGDSISMGYTPRVQEQLKGTANVYRIYCNGGDTARVIPAMMAMHEAMAEYWNFTWDVIHFNAGLHDLKYLDENRKYDTENGTQVRSPEEYGKNLREIIAYFRETAPRAKIIFATTTPVPENSRGRKAGDAVRFNEAALDVLKDYPEIEINDLYRFTQTNYAQWQRRPGDVHYNADGSAAQGDEVAKAIASVLPPEEPPGAASGIAELLSNLNPDAPGMEQVKSASATPRMAAEKLLKYYRSRDSVKHPVGRYSEAEMSGQVASAEDIQTADNALKHIFVGQPQYPPFFCGDDIDWSTRPVPDTEWVWQLNRMGFWDAMGRAYWHTGDEKYAEEWCVQVVDWVKKNPRDDQHLYAWRSIEAGIRGERWTGLFQRFIDSPAFTPEVLVAFLNSCHDHAAFLMTQYRKGSNWALIEAQGLAFIAMTFPEFTDSEKWRDEAIRRLNNEIRNQVNPDGHQHELSISYHMHSISKFMRVLELAAMNGRRGLFPPSYLQTVEKMCSAVMKLGLPDGSRAQFGDSWTSQPGANWTLLEKWAALFGRKDFLYVATEGQEGERPEATAFALKDSGFYSMRSGWDKEAVCLVLKCGPDGGSHCQPDNGTFELYAGGRHLMPDSGSYIYRGDEENRAWFRKTRHHQTVTLNGENTAYAPKLLLWKPGQDLDWLVVENAGYTNLTHRRAVAFVDKKFFIIVDEAYGEGAGNVDLHFQLAPENAVYDDEAFGVHTDSADGWNVLVQSVEQEGMSLEEEEGQVSFVYTQKEPRPAFRYRLRKQADESGVRFITLVAPYHGPLPEIRVRVKGEPEIGAQRLELDILKDGVSKRIGYNLSK